MEKNELGNFIESMRFHQEQSHAKRAEIQESQDEFEKQLYLDNLEMLVSSARVIGFAAQRENVEHDVIAGGTFEETERGFLFGKFKKEVIVQQAESGWKIIEKTFDGDWWHMRKHGVMLTPHGNLYVYQGAYFPEYNRIYNRLIYPVANYETSYRITSDPNELKTLDPLPISFGSFFVPITVEDALEGLIDFAISHNLEV